MSKSIASESLDHNESQKNGGKRGAEDEGIGDEESILEVPPAESLTISSTVSTAPPTWITKLRKIELRAELDDRLVKYEKKDKKFVLINLLILEIRMRARIPALNEDVMGHIVSFLGERRDGANGYRQLHPLAKNGDPFKSLRLAAQISRGFWIGAKRVLQQIIDQDQRNKDLRSKVKEWVKDQEGAMAKYGHISDWDVSEVTIMRGLFCGAGNNVHCHCFELTRFNDDISRWDTGRVEDMGWIFCGAQAFDGDISGWDIKRVRNMRCMFMGAISFTESNLEILSNNWDLSRLEDDQFPFYCIGAGFGCAGVIFDGNVTGYDGGVVRKYSGVCEGCAQRIKEVLIYISLITEYDDSDDELRHTQKLTFQFSFSKSQPQVF